MGTIEKVRGAALQARSDFEKCIVSKDLMRELSISSDPALQHVFDRYFDDTIQKFPRGNCRLAAIYLKHLAGFGHVAEGTYGGNYHRFWAGEEGELIADITADQFGGPKVYVGRVVAPWSINLERS